MNLIAISLVLGLGVMLAVLTWSLLKFNAVTETNQVILNIQTALSDKSYYRDQYLLFWQDRNKTEWLKRQRNIEEVLNSDALRNVQTSDYFNTQNLLVALRDSERIFQRIIVGTDKLRNQDAGRVASDELLKRLVSQMLVKDTLVSDEFYSMQKRQEGRVNAAYRQLIFSIGFGALILVCMVTGALYFLSRLIKSRLMVLHSGAQIVAGGQLDFRFNFRGADEFTDVARSINDMTQSLQVVKHSLETELANKGRIELELRRSEVLLKSAARIAGVGAWQIDTSSGEVNWSEQTCLIHDLEPGFKPTFEQAMHFFVPDARASITGLIQKAVASNENFDVELEMITAKGRNIWIRALGGRDSVGVWDSSRVIGTFQDVTERRLLDRIKSEFISMVSHELRTPLTSIRGSLSLLQSGVMGELPTNVEQLVIVAHRNSNRLVALVNDILDINKLASNALTMDMQVHDLLGLITQSIENNMAYADDYDVSLEFSSSLKEAFAFVDAGRFLQVLANLISNAIKFSNKGSTVQIQLEKIDRQYKLQVTDSGIGIPDDFKTKIFQQFSQADNSNTRHNGGSGLGLYITKKLVEKMWGSIGFDSIEGKGSTFWILLDVAGPETLEVRENLEKYGARQVSGSLSG